MAGGRVRRKYFPGNFFPTRASDWMNALLFFGPTIWMRLPANRPYDFCDGPSCSARAEWDIPKVQSRKMPKIFSRFPRAWRGFLREIDRPRRVQARTNQGFGPVLVKRQNVQTAKRP